MRGEVTELFNYNRSARSSNLFILFVMNIAASVLDLQPGHRIVVEDILQG